MPVVRVGGETGFGGPCARREGKPTRPVGRAGADCSNGEKTMRWKSLTGGLALVVAAAGGCTKQCYITCEDAVQSSALVASNMGEEPRTITFSDGFQLKAEPRKFTTASGK